ncbi:glycine cleavage system aminomethyltransferase GcvT [Aquimarina agarivorans]|uniref:glycine cleavage system aminomethyltransferase GcvT n=1 Tax=Aquimarina agarivorans TaxID=980584 RepID=UPI000248EA28|nr:glycine cleavage system aminomethyltransferase GcvT [Aquimarina agarivorans]
MKNTPLTQKHISLGAKMVPFAGFNMPVSYKGVKHEHQIVRSHVGVFDVSHMGEFLVSGPNALALLQKITSNNVEKLTIGQAQYSCMPNETGGIIDDLLVYRIKNDTYLLVVNAANIEKDFNWILKHNSENAELRNISDAYSLLAIQGPKAIPAMQELTNVNLADIPYYHFKIGDFAGIEHVIISATGYTGSGGFEIYCKNTEVEQIWDAIFKAGADFNIEPAGLAARDTLRLEMGFCLYGNDIDDKTSTIEAGLSWITKFDKDFINASYLKNQKEQGVTKKLVGFELLDRGIPRKDYEIMSLEGDIIGKVTSGTMAPSLEKAIGMGYVDAKFSKATTEIYILIRNKKIPAKVVKMPFFTK